MYTVSVPISVPVSSTKKFHLNINQYRNAHHFTLSKAKNVFHDIVAPRVRHLPEMEAVDLLYTLFVGSAQLVDTNNVCCIVDKFFSDVLVNTDRLSDDNCHIVKDTTFSYGGIDKSNPRVEVTVTPRSLGGGRVTTSQEPKGKTMKISLVQTEIEDAIRDYINSQIAIREDQEIEIDLRATRGDEGFQAFIDIVSIRRSTPIKVDPVNEPQAEVQAPKPTVAVTKGRAKASKVEAEPEAPEPSILDDAEPAEVGSLADDLPATPVEEPVSEDDTPKRPSLFSTMKKPENA